MQYPVADTDALFDIQVSQEAFDLIDRKSKTIGLHPHVLVDQTAHLLLASLIQKDIPIPKISKGAIFLGHVQQGSTYRLPISRPVANLLRPYLTTLGCGLAPLMNNAIEKNRFNIQRMQPLNCRSMNSIRMKLFKMEQGLDPLEPYAAQRG